MPAAAKPTSSAGSSEPGFRLPVRPTAPVPGAGFKMAFFLDCCGKQAHDLCEAWPFFAEAAQQGVCKALSVN